MGAEIILNSIRCADAVRYMSVNAGVQPLHCTDSHGHRPQERADVPELQALRRLTD
jgi:hypothetical protein